MCGLFIFIESTNNMTRGVNYMKGLVKKSKIFSMALLMGLGVFASTSSAFAEDYTAENSLTNLYYKSGNDDMVLSPDTVVRNTYWAALEEVSVMIGADRFYGVLPKYICKPSETELKDFDIKIIPSVGITEHELGVKIIEPDHFYRYGFYIGDDFNAWSAYGQNGYVPGDIVPDIDNPFKIREEDVLKREEIEHPGKINVYGDLKENGSIDSSKIGEYKVGDEISIDFTIDASSIKRIFMGNTLNMTRLGLNEIDSNKVYKNTKGMIDSQLISEIVIPEGVDASRASVSLSGLEGYFKLEKSINSNKMLISLRLKENVRGKEKSWKDLIEKVKDVDTKNIKITVSGLYVNSKAQVDKNIKLKASVGGYLDWANSVYIPSPTSSPIPIPLSYPPSVYDNYNRIYLPFVARQSETGRDKDLPDNKPNLISYTFRVKKDQYKPYNPNKPTPGRIDGPDRIETGINISKKYYDKAKTVIVVRHDLFPDSMTASVLAKLKDAPILLNPTDKLDSRVGDEIKRLGAEEVIIVGGQNSVSEKVREELKSYDADKNVERIAGTDRYGTSEMVAKRVVGITGKKNTGVVASGQVFPDALSVGTFASREGYPILLVKKDSVPSQIQNAIKDLDINKTYIAGGTNTISKSTEAKLPGVLERMAGNTRYETSVAIAKSKFGASKEAYIASGEEFADALVISPISGKFNRPTLLVSRNKNSNSPVKTYIRNAGFTSITAIGGERFVPYSVLEDLVK